MLTLRFDDRTRLCGYDLNLTYPQTGGHFPTLNLTLPAGESDNSARVVAMSKSRANRFKSYFSPSSSAASVSPEKRQIDVDEEAVVAGREQMHDARKVEKRDLSGRANGTIDPWYGCFLGGELEDYALNFSKPWSE